MMGHSCAEDRVIWYGNNPRAVICNVLPYLPYQNAAKKRWLIFYVLRGLGPSVATITP